MHPQKNHKQTWWNKNLNDQTQFNTFLGWAGGYVASSKLVLRNFLKENDHFISILDIGCGPAIQKTFY